MNTGRFVCIGGILTAVAVLFQSAPVFFPAIGLAISPFATLPVAIAAVLNISLGFAVFFSSAFIIALVSVQEAIILVFATGLLGLTTGALLYRKRIILSIFFSGLALSFGMVLLTYVAGIPAFVNFSGSFSPASTFIIFFVFSLVYAGIWNIGTRKFMIELDKKLK